MLLKGCTGKVAIEEPPISEIFLSTLQYAISRRAASNKKPSSQYSPSGLNCIRSMYYKRIGIQPDEDLQAYDSLGAADTGTRRHDAIQSALIYMTATGSRFRYLDVGVYVSEKQKRGKCLNLKVLGKEGAETLLHDVERDVKFRCDGIIYDTVGQLFYLFEFKNQISYNAAGKQSVDAKHIAQVHCYCAELDLCRAIVLYENRDTCQLYLPEILEVTDFNKSMIMAKIDACEAMARDNTVPQRPASLSPSDCRYCRYKQQCKQDGKEGKEHAY